MKISKRIVTKKYRGQVGDTRHPEQNTMRVVPALANEMVKL